MTDIIQARRDRAAMSAVPGALEVRWVPDRTPIMPALKPSEPDDRWWVPLGACRGLDPDLFFPEIGAARPVEALSTCAVCEVREACLEWAMVHNERSGVWGGKTTDERRKHRRIWNAERRAR